MENERTPNWFEVSAHSDFSKSFILILDQKLPCGVFYKYSCVRAKDSGKYILGMNYGTEEWAYMREISRKKKKKTVPLELSEYQLGDKLLSKDGTLRTMIVAIGEAQLHLATKYNFPVVPSFLMEFYNFINGSPCSKEVDDEC